MDSPSRVPVSAIILAHIGPRGVLGGDLVRLCRRLGVAPEARDGALRALERGSLLVRVPEGEQIRFMRPEYAPKPPADPTTGRPRTERTKPAQPNNRPAIQARQAQRNANLADALDKLARGWTVEALTRMWRITRKAALARIGEARQWDALGRPGDWTKRRSK